MSAERLPYIQMSAAETLKSLSILRDCSDQEVELLVARMTEVPLPAGADLLTEGEMPEAAFILKEGRLRVTSRGEILAVIDFVASFGEISCLLPDMPVGATVSAERDSTVYRIAKADLLEVIDQVPKLWRALFAQSSERLQRLNKRFSEVLEHSPQGFVKLDRNACVTNEYSKKAIEFLGQTKPLAGISFPEVLMSGDAASRASWQSVFGMVFDDVGVPLSDLFYLLPAETCLEAHGVTRDLTFEFHPIYEAGEVVAVDVGIEDVTRQRELERASEMELERQRTLGKIYQNPDSFFGLLRLIEEVEAAAAKVLAGVYAEGLEPFRNDIGALMRDLHSLKGFAGNFGLTELQRSAHALESILVSSAESAAEESAPAPDDRVAKARETLAQNGIGVQITRDLKALLRFASDFGLQDLQNAAQKLETALEPVSAAPHRGSRGFAARMDSALDRLRQAASDGRALKAMIDPSLLRRLEGVVLLPAQVEAMRAALGSADTTEALQILQAAESVDSKQLFACWPADVDRLCKHFKKAARVEVYGAGGMVPKPVFMALDRVFIHILNNMMDHGIEDPETRLGAEKDPEGLISVIVEVSDDRLSIEVSDDGAGADFSAICQKALANPNLDPDEVARCAEQGEPWRVLTMPGFSTASQLTDYSGRGVGLDAVATAVTDLGGQVSIDSVLGQRFTFRIEVPLGAPTAQVS